MITGFSERLLAQYLDSRDSRQNARLMAGRVFRGAIRTVNPSTSVANLFFVNINRTEDQASGATDLTPYACSIPGYTPTVGDVVDLFWRSRNEAIVLQVVNGASAREIQSGIVTATVIAAGREITGSVTFPQPYPTAVTPMVFLAIQNVNAAAAAERPVGVAAFSITNTVFSFSIDLFAAAGANRTLSVAWLAIG